MPAATFSIVKKLNILNKAELNGTLALNSLSENSLKKLFQTITQTEFKILGKGPFKDEFVTCGGVDCKEINFKTMASKKCDNLFIIGETLDIDGLTGGFNFQNAWTTGFIAGHS